MKGALGILLGAFGLWSTFITHHVQLYVEFYELTTVIKGRELESNIWSRIVICSVSM